MAYRTVQKGDQVSEYTLLDKLGEGGFGEVWKAEHSQIPGKYVAIKIPTHPENMDRLRQEAVFQHELDHPNIVKTIGLNTQNDPPYFIMEYVEGKNLRQLMLDDGILPPPYAIDIAVQVCEALAFAHGRGIVHKDVKPENILVEKKRVDVSNKGKALLHYVKLTDLGLGMFPGRGQSEIVISQNSRTSGVRIMSGTLFYMAPEQMMPHRQVDARADIYSVGVVLYEMLTGELPLGMDLPSELNPVVTPQLDAVCKRALSVDRDMRYQTMRELAADLQKAKEALLLRLVAQGAPALEVTPQGELRETAASAAVARRRRWMPVLEWSLLAFVVALLAISCTTFFRLRRDADRREQVRAAEPVRAPGPLSLDTRPTGAEVWLDGRRMGVAPLALPSLSHERHLLKFTREFHAARELVLEPRTVDGKLLFAVVDRGTRQPLTLLDALAGSTLSDIDLSRLKGRVRIDTPGKEPAEVRVDDEFYGPTPFNKELEAGIHRFTIRKDGHKELSFFERVEGGATVGKEIALLEVGRPEPAPKPAAFRIHLSTTPPGATVLVNGQDRGTTPCDLDLAPGDYDLRLAKKYHEPRTATLAVNGSGSREFELAKVRQAVSFESDPPGATVYVDGVQVGVAPVTVEGVEGGSHKATFALPGHYDQAATFEVLGREPSERPIKATLQKIPPGILVFESDLRGFEVFLDGAPLGRLPLGSKTVEAGRRRITVLGVERTIQVEPAVEQKISLGLKDLEMVRVDEGDFPYGTASPNMGEIPVRTEKTAAYLIDQYEVSNEKYALFLDHIRKTADHSRCHPEEIRSPAPGHEPRYWNDPRFNGARHPVVGVTWFDAYAYAAWAGKRLPREVEWEKAARGSTRSIYPWGDDFGPQEKRCNWGDPNGMYDGYPLTAPVGACPGRSPYRCFDMVGNAREWCADDFSTKDRHKVVRGGDYLAKSYSNTISREKEDRLHTSTTVGFRCVADEKK